MVEWWWLLVAFYAGAALCSLVWIFAAGPVNMKKDWPLVLFGTLAWPVFVLGLLSDH